MKFKVGEKVRIINPCSANRGRVSRIKIVEDTICYLEGIFGWFKEDELELVEEKQETKFKVGDIVVCVDNSVVERLLHVGKRYTIRKVTDEYVYLDDNNLGGFFHDRFKLVEEKQEKPINELKYQVSLDTKELTTKLDIILKHLQAMSDELKENEK